MQLKTLERARKLSCVTTHEHQFHVFSRVFAHFVFTQNRYNLKY